MSVLGIRVIPVSLGGARSSGRAIYGSFEDFPEKAQGFAHSTVYPGYGAGYAFCRPSTVSLLPAVSSAPVFPMDRDQIAKELTARGLKPTDQRIRIAAVLMSAPQHLTAEQILAAVRQTGEHVSKATVYNTLKVLAQHGLVRQIHLDPERSVYDSTRAPHHHFHDLETGELRDIHPDEIAFSRFPEIPPDMEAEGIEVVIRLRKKRS